MITIYKKKPSKNDMELIDLNDIFFNKYTAELLDDKAAALIEQIDQKCSANIRSVQDLTEHSANIGTYLGLITPQKKLLKAALSRFA